MKLSIDDLVFLKSELNNTRIMNEEDLVYIKASHPQLYFATQLKKDEGVSLFPNNSWVYTLENKNLNEFIFLSSARVPSLSPCFRTETFASHRKDPSCILPSQISIY